MAQQAHGRHNIMKMDEPKLYGDLSSDERILMLQRLCNTKEAKATAEVGATIPLSRNQRDKNRGSRSRMSLVLAQVDVQMDSRRPLLGSHCKDAYHLHVRKSLHGTKRNAVCLYALYMLHTSRIRSLY